MVKWKRWKTNLNIIVKIKCLEHSSALQGLNIRFVRVGSNMALFKEMETAYISTTHFQN